jgi:ABC-type Fe3+/spermidine/putrescine transport system ATPase subunit
MVTSDRIAVMREGRVEQVGTAREVYEAPATPFVAQFVGRTNLLRGVLEAGHQVRIADGLAVRVADARGLGRGARVAVSVRPHRIVMSPDAGAGERGWNVLTGRVARVAYFGDALDVQVALPDGGPVLRLSARPDAALAVGHPVTLGIPPDACVVLDGG